MSNLKRNTIILLILFNIFCKIAYSQNSAAALQPVQMTVKTHIFQHQAHVNQIYYNV